MTFSFDEAFDYLFSFDDPYLAALRDHGKQTWGLEGVRILLERLGNPHLAYPTVHIAGTKGKGSTAAFITQALIASGLRTGMYATPHLEDWRERIQVNRELISPGSLAAGMYAIKDAIGDLPLSTFEVATALAFLHYAREGCDIAVIEVGLGGRLDATSVVEPAVAVLTHISFDHTQLLGNTLTEIAGEKAAIIKMGTPVVSAIQEDEAMSVIRARAEAMGSRLTVCQKPELIEARWNGSRATFRTPNSQDIFDVGLPGLYQLDNAASALLALEELKSAGLPISDEACRTGLKAVKWPGRLEVVSENPRIVVDSAHNPYSISQVMETVKLLLDAEGTRPVIVFGCMADKDSAGMLKAMLRGASHIIFTQADHGRAAAADDLLALAKSLQSDNHALGLNNVIGVILEQEQTTASAVKKAIEAAGENDTILITGSLSVAGEALTALAVMHGRGNGISHSHHSTASTPA